MKNEREVVETLTEVQLSSDEAELWDGEPEMYINQGWMEALQWVIGLKKEKRYNYGQNKDESGGFPIKEGL
jgi:hypothetical protein|tara:strand:- start:439 stop:651 length:213 start_codon:yes stop_codon:yes gene_type:complete